MKVRNREAERRESDPFAELNQYRKAAAVFAPGGWIWASDERTNKYLAFARTIDAPEPVAAIEFRISASYHYELYINGAFANRGPVHGDPKWCHYDDLLVELGERVDRIDLFVVVHHSTGTHIHSLTPAPGGLICRVQAGSVVVGTDATWRGRILPMWSDAVSARNWALGYCEDYDARLEPAGWSEKRIGAPELESWRPAVEVENSDETWGAYQPRVTPLLIRRNVEPVTFSAFRAPGLGAGDVFGVSEYSDTEELVVVARDLAFDIDAINDLVPEANAFTLDLGKEYVGFYSIDLEAPRGTVVELSGAELLQPHASGRPWIFRKGGNYSLRYTSRGGRGRFTSFSWNGFRYLHVVLRSNVRRCRFHWIGAVERSAGLSACRRPEITDPDLRRIVAMCERTLAVAPQEHIVDCPTREQSPAFADGLIASAALLKGFCRPSYLLWHLEATLRAPLNEHGLFCGRYPSTAGYWLDFCLVAFRAQTYYERETGRYYKPRETLARWLAVMHWFERNSNDDGIVDFPFQECYRKGLRNFIDHPGLGMHNSPHPGIDRDGASCPLNTHFYAFLKILTSLAAAADEPAEAERLAGRAASLRGAIREWFFDGAVFHDARKEGRLSPFTSWQTNALAVLFDVAEENERRDVMRRMLDGYDRLCRCTPYGYYYFLQALRKADLHEEAIEIIKLEWGKMIKGGATTTWEGFEGDAKDSLCHVWATYPFLYLLENEGA